MTSKDTQQTFPFPYDAVFDTVVVVFPTIKFKLITHDRAIGQITAKTPATLFSWGENLTILVQKIDDNASMITMESSLKVAVNIAGAGRHTKNFNKVIAAASSQLQQQTANV